MELKEAGPVRSAQAGTFGGRRRGWLQRGRFVPFSNRRPPVLFFQNSEAQAARTIGDGVRSAGD